MEQLELIKDMDSESKRQWRDHLYQIAPCIVEAYELLGKDMIEGLKYSTQKIREAMILARYRKNITSTAFMELMKNTFIVGRKYRVEEIKEIILSVYEKLGIVPLRSVTAQTLNEFFETKPTLLGKKRDRALYIARGKY